MRLEMLDFHRARCIYLPLELQEVSTPRTVAATVTTAKGTMWWMARMSLCPAGSGAP